MSEREREREREREVRVGVGGRPRWETGGGGRAHLHDHVIESIDRRFGSGEEITAFLVDGALVALILHHRGQQPQRHSGPNLRHSTRKLHHCAFVCTG